MAAPGENLRINSDRLWDSLMEMAKIGPGVAGGNNRQTLTDEDGEGRRLFQTWCDAADLTTGVDQMGTMFARRVAPCLEETPPLAVLVGQRLAVIAASDAGTDLRHLHQRVPETV